MEHRVKHIDHRGQEVLLDKPLNESAMTATEKAEWHKKRHEEQHKKEQE